MKLISLSVWGEQPIYWVGALANAQLHQSIYPGWRLRLYTDTENDFTERIKACGAEIRRVENLGGFHGTFWRFLPVSEPGLEAIIVRDADSLLNVREAAAVAAWLQSGKAAHVMRDYPQHLSWPMLGGMWGVRGGVITDIEARIRAWGQWQDKHDDQYFLRQVIWPLIARDCIQHTSGASPWGGEPFPAHGPCDCDYVGQPYYEAAAGQRSRRALVRDSPAGPRHAAGALEGALPQPLRPELQLLFACVRALSDARAPGVIRQLLQDFTDWGAFARAALDHGLAALAAHTLSDAAPDLVPEDILAALRTNLDRTRKSNRASLDELSRVIAALAEAHIEPIALGGPVTVLQAYGDLALRAVEGLGILVRPGELAAARAALRSLGYASQEPMSAAQCELLLQLRGQELLFKDRLELPLTVRTRLTALKSALDIDHAALWNRAQRLESSGTQLRTLAPEDTLLVFAIQGGTESWRNLGWACDAAAFIGRHPQLDWSAVLERARAHGCRRLLLLATSLARTGFDTTIPPAVVAAERADPVIERMRRWVVQNWHAASTSRRARRAFPLQQLRLHDGALRRARYVARTLLLPTPEQVASMALPHGLRFAYVPIGAARTLLALPWRAARQARVLAGRLLMGLSAWEAPLAALPASTQQKLRLQRYQRQRAAADRALAADPNDAAAWRRLGDALCGLGRYGEAIAYYDQALALAPADAAASKRRAAAIRALGAAAHSAAL
jgi:tetratricopeptide (TPR) repeat protein